MNQFTAAYEEYQATKLAERLELKYLDRPYYLRYQGLRSVSLLASYCFNVLSACTASILVYYFLLEMIEHTVGAIALTIGAMALLEVAKRLTASAVFKDYLISGSAEIRLVCVAVMLSGISILASYHGADKAVQTFADEPELIAPYQVVHPYNERISALTDQINLAASNKWKGTIYKESRKTISVLTEQVAAIEKERSEAIKEAKEKNESIVSNHSKATESKRQPFALFALFVDLLFLMCAAYLEYWDYRTYHEMQPLEDALSKEAKERSLANINTDSDGANLHALGRTDEIVSQKIGVSQRTYHDLKKVNNNGTDSLKSAVREKKIGASKLTGDEIKKLKSQLASYHYRLRNGIGKAETAQKRIAEIEAQLG